MAFEAGQIDRAVGANVAFGSRPGQTNRDPPGNHRSATGLPLATDQ